MEFCVSAWPLAACQSGVLLADVSKKNRYHFKHYGNYLGLSFQIIDDVMDILGDEEELKKEPGQDFELGEVTLPILYLLDEASKEEKMRIITLLRSQDPHSLLEIRKKIQQSHSALQKTEATAEKYLNRASKELSFLSHSRYKLALLGIINYIKQRSFKEKVSTASKT